MKFFVTGVGGQLGHDVMNELLKRGHEGVGSDIQETYSGVADGSAVTKAPYVALDITDKEAVEKVITEVNPDAVIHCAAWTAVDMAEDDDKVAKVRKANGDGCMDETKVDGVTRINDHEFEFHNEEPSIVLPSLWIPIATYPAPEIYSTRGPPLKPPVKSQSPLRYFEV